MKRDNEQVSYNCLRLIICGYSRGREVDKGVHEKRTHTLEHTQTHATFLMGIITLPLSTEINSIRNSVA